MKPRMSIFVLTLVPFLLGNPVFAQRPGHKLHATVKRGPALAALRAERANFLRRGGRRAFRSENPLLRLSGGRVVVDAVASGHPDTLRADLEKLGMADISQKGNVVSGLLPISSIDALETLGSLQFARPSYAMTWAGSVDSQGDAAMRADTARALFGVDGTGITVGTRSDTFDCAGTEAASDVGTGDLPSGIEVLDDSVCPGTDEGRAMMQLIHDVAPGAGQSFHTAFGGQADFALGIEELAGCPPGSEPTCAPALTAADVIVDDVIYFAEPMFQDGIIAQAVDVVTDAGVSYFSSAGNNARASYEASFDLAGGRHDFEPGPGVDTCQAITIPTGTTILSFQWTEPFFSVSGPPGSASDLDIGLYFDVAGCTPSSFTGLGGFAGNVAGDPVEVFGVTNSGPSVTLGLQISLFSGPSPARVKYVVFSNSGFSMDEFDTASGTLFGHANAQGAEAVGAAFYGLTPEFGTAPPLLELFSSAGSTPIFFDTGGFSLPAVEVRDKPEIVAPDGANTTFFGFDVEPDGAPNFFGTSAAAPHAAAVAALMLEVSPALSPAAQYLALESTAIDMDDPATGGFDVGFDYGTGFGLIDAVAAIGAIGPVSVLTSISVTPSGGVSIETGQNQPFAALGTFDDGSTADLTSTATWSSSNPAVAAVGSSGLATGVGVGGADISATQDGIVSNAASLTVVAPPGDLVTILSAQYKPDRGEFKVRATSSQQPGAVLTVVGFGQMSFKKGKYELKIKPLALELVPATVTVQSSLGGSATASVAGAPAPPAALVSIVVSPANPSVGMGLTRAFAATGTFDDASTADLTASVGWLSASPSVATIDAAGVASGVSVGSTAVTASLAGVTSPAVVLDVTPPPALLSLAVTPASGASIEVGQSQQFTATGTFDDGSTADVTASVSWNSSNASAATIDTGGLATAVSLGSTSITATHDGVTSPAVALEVVESAGDEVSITKAEWKKKNSELKVEATSSANPDAVLTVVGFGQMTFRRGKYELRLKPVVNPGTVTVISSLGGSATKSVRVR